MRSERKIWIMLLYLIGKNGENFNESLNFISRFGKDNRLNDKKMKRAAHGGMDRPFIEWKRKKLWRYNNASSLSTLKFIYNCYVVVCQAFFWVFPKKIIYTQNIV